jgi:hypothetical protein
MNTDIKSIFYQGAFMFLKVSALLRKKLPHMRLSFSIFFLIATIFISSLIHFVFFQNRDSFINSIWWSILHLLDPGRLSEDHNGFFVRIFGLLIVFIGIFFVATIISNVVLDEGSKLMKRYIDGELPKHVKNHIMIIGDSDHIKYFLDFEIKKHISQNHNSDLVLLVHHQKELKKLRSYIESIKHDHQEGQFLNHIYTCCASMNHLDHYHSLKLDKVSHLIILENKIINASILIYLLENMIYQRKNRYQKEQKLDEVHVFMSIENTEIFQIIDYFILSKNDILSMLKIRVTYFNRYELSARLLLNQNMPFTDLTVDIKNHKIDYYRYTLLIDGYTNFSHQFLSQLFSIGIYEVSTTKVIIFDRKENNHFLKKLRNILERISHHHDHQEYANQILKIEIRNEDLELSKFFTQENMIFSLFISNQDDHLMINKMINYDKQLLALPKIKYKPRLILNLPDESAFRECKMIFENHFHIIKTPSILETFKSLKWIDHISKENHNDFLKIQEESGKREKDENGKYKYESHREWEDLPPMIKSWNKSNWDHTRVKICLIAQYFGLDLPQFKNDQVMISKALKDQIQVIIDVYQKAKDQMDQKKAMIKDGPQYDQELNMLYMQPLFTDLLLIDPSLQNIVDLIDYIAHVEHHRWSMERLFQGWLYAPKKDNMLKQHTDLIEYDQLSQYTKLYDIDSSIKNLKRILALAHITQASS